MKQKLSEFKPHNIHRRLQRKDSKIAEQKENIRRLEKDNVRTCVMELLSRNVGIRQVEPVIRAVMKMCKVNCDRLPQRTAIDDMLVESRSLCQIQLAEAHTDSTNNTLILMVH